MDKKPLHLLRSLSFILSASVLAGSFPSCNPDVFAETTDIDFIDSEETSSDTESSTEIPDSTEGNTFDTPNTELTDPSQDSADASDDELFSSEENELFTSGETSGSETDGLDYILGRPMTEE